MISVREFVEFARSFTSPRDIQYVTASPETIVAWDGTASYGKKHKNHLKKVRKQKHADKMRARRAKGRGRW